MFEIKVDTSACKSIITGYDSKINDAWCYSDQTFEGGKIYALVSESGQGCMYLSYLLGGKMDFKNVRIYLNEKEIHQADLQKLSHNLEPLEEPYGKFTVRKAIEKALKDKPGTETFPELAEKFLLTPERFDRKFRHLSGERWRASAAYGYAMGKKIFYAPYQTSTFYYQMCQSSLLKPLRELTSSGAMIFLPVGSDAFLKHIADEVIYLDRQYDTAQLKQFYSGLFGSDWVN